MRHRRTAALLTLILSAFLTVRLSAQVDLDRLALRFSSMTAVTGLEQAMTDSLRALFPGSVRDRAGNVTLTLGQGSPKRLCTCPLDEVGYVVGNILPDGFLLLRRVGGARTAYPLLDQQLEGHRLCGRRGELRGRGGGSRDRAAGARVAHQAAATVWRAPARRTVCRAAHRVCRARRGGAIEAQRERHGGRRVHGAEPVRDRRWARKREGWARAVRRH